MTKKTRIAELVVFVLVMVLFLAKLDRHYFFTDELLYVQEGLEHLEGRYEGTLQVPPLPKYFAALAYTLSENTLGLARIPFALLGVATAFVLYLIIKREYGVYYGFGGVFLYVASRTIFDATRMIMLEPLLHLFILLFLYFYYATFFKASRKVYLVSGLFFGLALLTKLTAVVLVPFVFLGLLYAFYNNRHDKPQVRRILSNYVQLFLVSGATVLVGYVHFMYKAGFATALIDTLKAIKNVYFAKSAEGKIHVIGGVVYEKSPWWTYFYYTATQNGLLRPLVYIVLSVAALWAKKFFVLYWVTFFVLVFGFSQLSGVKNVRYVSTFELPLIVLTVAGFNYLTNKLSRKKKAVELFAWVILSIFMLAQLVYIVRLDYTEYEDLYRYFKNETADFTEYKRMYVFGSVRSMEYYRDQIPNEEMLLWRRDYNKTCPEFDTFDYFAFDREELLKNPENYLYLYVRANMDYFERVPEIEEMLVFKKSRAFESLLSCPL